MRLIDADWLLDVVENIIDWDTERDRNRIIHQVRELTPTVDAEPRWIQCSERMPKEHEWLGTKRFGATKSDEVYVTFESPKGERFCKHVSFQNGKVSGYDQRFIDAICKGSRPVAWKPLPEPCQD